MNIAQIIDHTNIKKGAKAEDILKTCEEAKKYGFRGVCINPEWVKLVKEELKKTKRNYPAPKRRGIPFGASSFGGSKIKIIALIDPPMGISPHEERLAIAKGAKKDGADEIDVVMNIINLKYERYSEILEDLKEITKILPTKVIIGSGYLTDNEIKKASEIVKQSRAFCVKTATEKDPLDKLELKEKARHLKIMKESAPGLLIKASGGIKTLKDAKIMIGAGADIIGTSFGVEIARRIATRQ